MATIAYPNRNTGPGLGKDDTTVRPIEFEIDFSKMGTANSGDDITLGVLPRGTLIVAAAAQSITPGATAATLTLRQGTTAVAAALSSNAAANTVVGSAVTAPVVLTADANVNVLVGGTGAGSGRHRFVITVTEIVKPFVARLQTRDQISGTA